MATNMQAHAISESDGHVYLRYMILLVVLQAPTVFSWVSKALCDRVDRSPPCLPDVDPMAPLVTPS